MKKLFKVVLFPAILFSSLQLTSCNSLFHFHSLEWKYDEDTHWQECKTCHKKIGVTDHSMNDLTDRCFICDYHDPIIKTNGSATLTGLTRHGKKKETINLDDNILVIGKGSFDGSNCTKIRISDNFIGIEEGAFINSKVEEIVDPREGYVDWKYHDGFYFREDKIYENEVMIKNGEGTKFYPTFVDAIKAVDKNNVTLTLLRKEIDLDGIEEIDINYTMALEPLYSEGCVIKNTAQEKKTQFYIHPTGYLKIPSTITFSSPTHLILGPTTEKRGNLSDEEVYTSGSLIYSNREELPVTLPEEVDYVDVNKQSLGYEAQISKQTTGASLLNVSNYAYGVFKMDKGFTYIKGLTDFGETCTKLHITRPIVGKDFKISEAAFVVKGQIVIPIPILPDPKITLWKQKGIYSDLEIGDGITGIDTNAFANYIDQDIKELVEKIAYFLCPIVNVKIGNDVQYIGHNAFAQCISLDSVTVGNDASSKLELINSSAFEKCYLLKSVNLANCPNLKEIYNKAFSGCNELHSVTLPTTRFWHTEKDGFAYLPDDMTPENVSMFLKSTYVNHNWIHDTHEYKFAYCKNKERDAMGRFNKVYYVDTFPNNEEYDDNGVVYVFKSAGTDISLWNDDKTITKSVQIIAEDGVTGTFGAAGKTVKINKGKWLITSKNITHAHDGTILLEKENNKSTTEFKNLGGFAQEYEGTSAVINGYTAYNAGEDGKMTAEQTYVVINGKKYVTVGLFDFTLNQEGYDRYSKLTALTNLGKLASEILIKSPVTEAQTGSINDCDLYEKSLQNNNKITKLEFHDTIKNIHSAACENCLNLKEVIIGDAIKEISNYSFKNCSKLYKVTIKDNTVLNKIGLEAFKGDGSLKVFDFDSSTSVTTGWKAGETLISDSDLKDHSKAADYFSTKYCDVIWTRS